MLRALEAALEAGGSDAVKKSGIPRSPDRRRVSSSSWSSAASPVVALAGEGRTRGASVQNRETSRMIRERQQRAVHAMNDYMQQNSDLGSIFVVQYAQEKDSGKDAKGKSPSSKKGKRPASAAADSDDDALQDDPIISVDDDSKDFTLNECAHLCALLNDLHLQFNDMRHGKYSTMAMVNLLMQNRNVPKTVGAAGSKDKKTGAKEKKEEANRELDEPKGLMAVAGSFINRLLTKRSAEMSAEKKKEDGGKAMSREAKALLQQAAQGAKGKGKYEVERLVDPATDSAVGALRHRQLRNIAAAEEAARTHKCTSRCADGKCTKYDWDHNCPVQCRCEGETPYPAEPYIIWGGKWCFCEWCCSWQHTCCMREDKAVCFDEELDAREICYDTDFNYMCHLCSSMPQVKQMRSYGKARKPVILRVQAPPPLPAVARKLSVTPSKQAVVDAEDDTSGRGKAGSARKGGAGGESRKGAEEEDEGPKQKRRKRKRCFSRGPKGRPKKDGDDESDDDASEDEESGDEESEEEESATQRPNARRAGRVQNKMPEKGARKRIRAQSSGEESEDDARSVPKSIGKKKAKVTLKSRGKGAGRGRTKNAKGMAKSGTKGKDSAKLVSGSVKGKRKKQDKDDEVSQGQMRRASAGKGKKEETVSPKQGMILPDKNPRVRFSFLKLHHAKSVLGSGVRSPLFFSGSTIHANASDVYAWVQ